MAINSKAVKRHQHYINHMEEFKMVQHEYYVKHREEILNSDWYKEGLKTKKTTMRYRELRKELITILGSKCIKCGFSDIRALQIDHVNSGGRKEAKNFSSPWLMYTSILKKIKSGSKDYQLLCANCNWIKKCTNHEQFGSVVDKQQGDYIWQ